MTAKAQAGLGECASMMAALFTDMPPRESEAALLTFLAQLVDALPDARWAEMRASAKLPCGKPGCTCESRREWLMDALDELRDSWREQMA